LKQNTEWGGRKLGTQKTRRKNAKKMQSKMQKNAKKTQVRLFSFGFKKSDLSYYCPNFLIFQF